MPECENTCGECRFFKPIGRQVAVATSLDAPLRDVEVGRCPLKRNTATWMHSNDLVYPDGEFDEMSEACFDFVERIAA